MAGEFGYNLSVSDVYVFDSFKEGYMFNDISRVFVDWISYVYVWESMWTVVNATKFVFEDMGAVIFDKRRDNQVFMKLGLDEMRYKWYDFAVVSYGGYRMEGVKRLSSSERIMYGIDMLGLWLSQPQVRSFGEASASDVAEKVARDVLERYKNHAGFDYRVEVERSTDRGRYVQGNISSTQFLYYLASVARDGSGEKGYVCWFDRIRDEEENVDVVRYKMQSLKTLREKEVTKYMEFVFDYGDVERAFSNDGFSRKDTLPVLSFHIDSRNTGMLMNKKQFEIYEFDIKRLAVKKKEKDIVDKEEKDIVKSFFETVGKEYRMRAVDYADTGGWFGRYVANLLGLRYKRRLWVMVVGCSKLELGEKVRILLPTGYDNELIEALSGDWIVGSMVHMYSMPDKHWLMKVGLYQIDWNKRIE